MTTLKFEYQAGCTGGLRGHYMDVGAHMSLDMCHKACDAVGDKCKSVEFGGKDIGYQCRLWSGTCLETHPDGNSTSRVYTKAKKAAPVKPTGVVCPMPGPNVFMPPGCTPINAFVILL